MDLCCLFGSSRKFVCLENVVLRALVGDPNRHKPLAQHPPATTHKALEEIPASMYTLETRYQPIPPKVLPKPTEPRVYYIDSQQAGQPSQAMVREGMSLYFSILLEENMIDFVTIRTTYIIAY